MDLFQFGVLAVTGIMIFGGLAVSVSLIKNWPGRTPADPE